jgi:uncharacterized protein YkwD
MKAKNLLTSGFIALFLVFNISSCEENEGFHQISALESSIHNKVNDYRQTQGLSKLVLQPIMFKEARLHSEKMAGGLLPVDGTGMTEAFASVKDKIGGTTEGYVVFTTNQSNADSIVNSMLRDAGIVDIIKQTYTQSGVGVAYNNNLAYVTHMFLNIPSK